MGVMAFNLILKAKHSTTSYPQNSQEDELCSIGKFVIQHLGQEDRTKGVIPVHVDR